MKKSLFILSLFFSAHCAFSGNSADLSLNAANSIVDQYEDCTPVPFNFELDDNYVVSGMVYKTGPLAYSYVGFVTRYGVIVGSVTGYYQTELVDGVEVVLEETINETFSTEEAAAAVKAKHTAVKNAIQNVR